MAFCRNCGKEIDNHLKVCPHCGAACGGSPAVGISDGGVDYNELKFSASVVKKEKISKMLPVCSALILIMCLVLFLTYFIGWVQAYGQTLKIYMMVRGKVYGILYFLVYGLPLLIVLIVTIVIIVALCKFMFNYSKIRKVKLDGNISIGELKLLNRITETLSKISIGYCICCLILLCAQFIESSSTGSNIPFFKILLAEPELFMLMYGKGLCVAYYFTIIFAILSAAIGVYAVIVSNEYKTIYRYFLGKVAPDTPEPIKGKATKEEEEENKRLIAVADSLTIGAEYDKAVATYLKYFPDDGKEAISDLKTEKAYVKYKRLKDLPLGITFLVMTIIFMLWVGLAGSHSSEVVRAGSAAKISLGSSANKVERVLGSPDSNRGDCYIYSDSDDLENVEDIEDLTNMKFKELRIYFVEDKVNEIIYDAGSYDFSTDCKTFNIGNYQCLDYYKDGSVRIYYTL